MPQNIYSIASIARFIETQAFSSLSLSRNSRFAGNRGSQSAYTNNYFIAPYEPIRDYVWSFVGRFCVHTFSRY